MKALRALAALSLATAIPAGCLDTANNGANATPASPSGSCDDLPTLDELIQKFAVCRGVVPISGTASWALAKSNAEGALERFAECSLACIKAADSCDAMRACEGYDLQSTCEPGTDPRCEGSVLMECTEVDGRYVWRSSDCADDPHGNTECVLLTQGVGLPTPYVTGQCLGPACTEETVLTCDGDSLTACWKGHRSFIDCSVVDATCQESDGSATCVDAQQRSILGEGCVRGCDGDRYNPCSDDLPLLGVVFACSEQGPPELPPFQCVDEGDVRGCLPTPGANPTCTQARCDGDTLEECVGGVPYRIDCSGFAGGVCVDDGFPGPRCDTGSGGM